MQLQRALRKTLRNFYVACLMATTTWQRSATHCVKRGLTGSNAEHVGRRSRASSHRDPPIGICQGSPLRSEIEAGDPKQLEAVTEAAAEALARRFGQGPFEGGIQAIIFDAKRWEETKRADAATFCPVQILSSPHLLRGPIHPSR